MGHSRPSSICHVRPRLEHYFGLPDQAIGGAGGAKSRTTAKAHIAVAREIPWVNENVDGLGCQKVSTCSRPRCEKKKLNKK